MGAVRKAAQLALIYAALMGVYIVVSGRLAQDSSLSVEELARIERLKGLAFCAVSSLGLFLLAWWMNRRVLQDAEALTRARETLMLSERRALAGLFVASIAHDASNTATLLQAAVTELEELKGLPQEAQRSVADASLGLEKFMALVNNLKAFGKRNTGQPVDTDLSRLAAEAVRLAGSHSRARTCRLRMVAPAPVVAAVDPGMVNQLLVNLILNAADATQGRGTIELAVKADAGTATLEVSDDGPGIPEERRAHLFEPFSTTKPDGTGLGLVSVLACAQHHGGTVEVGTSSMGGARFLVSFPRSGPVTRAR